MWPFGKKRDNTLTPLFFTNSLSGTKERFVSQKPGQALLYSCGPTVYGPQHVGNLRAAVFADLVARTLKVSGYTVRRVINITDVGHLVGDEDEGEDKMQVGAAREHTTPAAIADRYTKRYLEDIRALNLSLDDIRFPRATDYIDEDIEMIRTLEVKGFTYTAPEGVYFDTEKFNDYGKLGNIAGVDLKGGARVALTSGKKNLHDFLLWRTAKKGDLQQWDSPWGSGNPGWHIECSVMSKALLGPSLDIHTGGMDHIAVHHNNEIAQSESANERPFVRYWMHNAFLTIDGEKISKSLGNTYTLTDVTNHGLHPLALRYLFLQAHYRSPLSFTWDAVTAANEALERLWAKAREIQKEAKGKQTDAEASVHIEALFRDDLATPAALALLWKTIEDDELLPREKWDALVRADAVLGLSLSNPPAAPETISLKDLPKEVRTLAEEREKARKDRDFTRADELRIHLTNRGYRVEDGPSGPVFTRI